jgi:hypothetical protein
MGMKAYPQLVTVQGISGAKSEQVPVEQFPGEHRRSQSDRGVVDEPPGVPKVPPPRQDSTDNTPNGQDRRDEHQRKLRYRCDVYCDDKAAECEKRVRCRCYS